MLSCWRQLQDRTFHPFAVSTGVGDAIAMNVMKFVNVTEHIRTISSPTSDDLSD